MRLACSNTVTKEHLKRAIAQTTKENDNSALVEFLLITGMRQKQWEHGLPKDVVKEVLQPFKDLDKLHQNQELVIRLVDIHLESEYAQKVKQHLNEPQKDSWIPFWGTTQDYTKVLYWSPLVAKIIDDGCTDKDIRWCINNTTWWVRHPSLPNLSINTVGRNKKQTLFDIYANKTEFPGISELIMYQGGMTKKAFLAEYKKRADDYAHRHEVTSMNGSISLGSKPVDTETTDWCKPYLKLDVISKEQVQKFFIEIIPLIAQGKLRPTQKIRGKSLLLLATEHGLVREMDLLLTGYNVPIGKKVFEVAGKSKQKCERVLNEHKKRNESKIKHPDCSNKPKYYEEVGATGGVKELYDKLRATQMQMALLQTILDAQEKGKNTENSDESYPVQAAITFGNSGASKSDENFLQKQSEKKKKRVKSSFLIKRNNAGEGIPTFMEG